MVMQQQQLLCAVLVLLASAPAEGKEPVNVKVGLVLDTGTLFGKMCLTSVNLAVDEFYARHPNHTTRLAVHVADSKRTTVGAASAALDLLKKVEVDALIGTQSSSQAVFVSDLAAKAEVPLVSFTATSPSLSARNPFFVRTTLNDSAQVAAISSLVHSFSWREVALLYEDSEFGSGIIPPLIDALQDAGAQVTHRSLVRPFANATEVEDVLLPLRAMRTKVFVVHMDQKPGSVLFSKASDLGMMGRGYVWIMTTGITMELESMEREVLTSGSMEGVVGLRPFVNARKVLEEFTRRWKFKFQEENGRKDGIPDPNVFDLWAYDTIYALAMAAEKVGISMKPSFWRTEQGNGTNNSLLDLRVSRIGRKLLDSMLGTDFDGISGRFQLIDGQLEVVAFELINVVGGSVRTVGYWTPSVGISRYMDSKAKIKGITWPGKLKKPPRGWEWPTDEKKLRIGVPLAAGFLNFASLRHDGRSNKTVGSGFCIEVFEAAMKMLDYEVPFEYVPFSNGTYDKLVYQVYLSNFDAVVGDVTIWSNRSTYVDFTTPFTESGVVMIVAIKEDPQHLWSFLDPMTYQLWLATLAAFILTGFVVWLLEHRDNPAFRVSSFDEFGKVLYFSFSTMVYGHREDMRSNFSRIVMVVWVFVVLVLVSSYTASLSSMLTSQQLQPSVIDATDLINRGEKVGYLKNSFIKSLLIDLGFHEGNLVPFASPDEYAEALSNGSLNGGVAAIFDEIPYVRIFLSKYTSKYTVVGRTYKTDGFGFVFPRGSPLVPDISRAILSVKEGDEMLEFEKNLYGDLANAPLSKFGDQGVASVTNRLSFRRFLGLFLITGITSFIALVSHLVLFSYENRDALNQIIQENHYVWRRPFQITRLLILGTGNPEAAAVVAGS